MQKCESSKAVCPPLQGSYGVVKLAYNEDSEKYYVSFNATSTELLFFLKKKKSICKSYKSFLLYLGNESCLQKEADETVWIFA